MNAPSYARQITADHAPKLREWPPIGSGPLLWCLVRRDACGRHGTLAGWRRSGPILVVSAVAWALVVWIWPGLHLTPPPRTAAPTHAAPAPNAASRPSKTRHQRALAQQGLVVFNPPDEMWQGRKERVEVGIARSAALREELLKGLRGRGKPQFEEIETSPVTSVELKGGDEDAFEITLHSAAEQGVDPAARWEFDVLPVRAGMQVLVLSICLRLAGARLDMPRIGNRSVPVLERPIRIRVNVGYSTRRFLARNWQWLIGTAICLGGGIAA